jgi:hypothetical protein
MPAATERALTPPASGLDAWLAAFTAEVQSAARIARLLGARRSPLAARLARRSCAPSGDATEARTFRAMFGPQASRKRWRGLTLAMPARTVADLLSPVLDWANDDGVTSDGASVVEAQ